MGVILFLAALGGVFALGMAIGRSRARRRAAGALPTAARAYDEGFHAGYLAGRQDAGRQDSPAGDPDQRAAGQSAAARPGGAAPDPVGRAATPTAAGGPALPTPATAAGEDGPSVQVPPVGRPGPLPAFPAGPVQPSVQVQPSVPVQPPGLVQPLVPGQPLASGEPSVPVQPPGRMRPLAPAQPSAPGQPLGPGQPPGNFPFGLGQAGAGSRQEDEPSPEELQARKRRRDLRNINITLYTASLLLVAAAGLFIGAAVPEPARFGGVLLATGLFYAAGLLVHARSRRLRPAATAFTGTGLALIPVTGVALYSFVVPDGPVAWLLTSVAGTVAFAYAAAKLDSRVVAYLGVTFLLSTGLAFGAALRGGLIWYFLLTVVLATLISLAAVRRPRWVHRLYLEAFVASHRFLVPAVAVGVVLTAGETGRWPFALVFLAFAAYYAVQLATGPAAEHRVNGYALRAALTVAAAALAYAATAEPPAAAAAVIAASAGQLLLVLRRPESYPGSAVPFPARWHGSAPISQGGGNSPGPAVRADAGLLLAASVLALILLAAWAAEDTRPWFVPVFIVCAGVLQGLFLAAGKLGTGFERAALAVPLVALLPRLAAPDAGTLWGGICALTVLCAWYAAAAIRTQAAQAAPVLLARAAGVLLAPLTVLALLEPAPEAGDYALGAGAAAALAVLLTAAARVAVGRTEHYAAPTTAAAGCLAALLAWVVRAAEYPQATVSGVLLWVLAGVGIAASLLLTVRRKNNEARHLLIVGTFLAPAGLVTAALIGGGILGWGGYTLLTAAGLLYFAVMSVRAAEEEQRGVHLLVSQLLLAVTVVLAAGWRHAEPGVLYLAGTLTLVLAQGIRTRLDATGRFGLPEPPRWASAALLLLAAAVGVFDGRVGEQHAVALAVLAVGTPVAWELFARLRRGRGSGEWTDADLYIFSAAGGLALMLPVLGQSIDRNVTLALIWAWLAGNLVVAGSCRSRLPELLAPAGFIWSALAGVGVLGVRGYLLLSAAAVLWFGWRSLASGPLRGVQLLTAQALAAVTAGLAASEVGGGPGAVFITAAAVTAALHLGRELFFSRLAALGAAQSARWMMLLLLLVLPLIFSAVPGAGAGDLRVLIFVAAGAAAATQMSAAVRVAGTLRTREVGPPDAPPAGGHAPGLEPGRASAGAGAVYTAAAAAAAGWAAVGTDRWFRFGDTGPSVALLWSVLAVGTLAAAVLWRSAEPARGDGALPGSTARSAGSAGILGGSDAAGPQPAGGSGAPDGIGGGTRGYGPGGAFRSLAAAWGTAMGAAGFPAAAAAGACLLGLRGYELLVGAALTYCLACIAASGPRFRALHGLGVQGLAVLLAGLAAADLFAADAGVGREAGDGGAVWLGAGALAATLQVLRVVFQPRLRSAHLAAGGVQHAAEYATYALLAALPLFYQAAAAGQARRDTTAALVLLLVLTAGVGGLRGRSVGGLVTALAAAPAVPLLLAGFPPLASSDLLPKPVPGWAAALLLAGLTAAVLRGHVACVESRRAGAVPGAAARAAHAPGAGTAYLAAACLYPLLTVLPGLRDSDPLPTAIGAAAVAAVLLTVSFTARLPWLAAGFVAAVCCSGAAFFAWFRTDLLQARVQPDTALLWQAWIAALVLAAARLLLSLRGDNPENALRARITGAAGSPLLAAAGTAAMAGYGSSAVVGSFTLMVALAAAVAEVPPRRRELAAEAAVFPAALAVERILWFFLGVDWFWSLQYWVLILALLAAWELRRGRGRRGSGFLVAAGTILSGAGLITVVDGDTDRQLWALLGHAGLLVFGLLNARRLFAVWGAAGIALAVLWYLRGYTFVLLALLAVTLIALAVWRLVRVRSDGPDEPGSRGGDGPPPPVQGPSGAADPRTHASGSGSAQPRKQDEPRPPWHPPVQPGPAGEGPYAAPNGGPVPDGAPAVDGAPAPEGGTAPAGGTAPGRAGASGPWVPPGQ